MRTMGTNVHEACITLFYILLHSVECLECWYVMVAASVQFGTMYRYSMYTLHVLCMGSPDLCAGQVMPYFMVMWLA